jgi:hypothetical protein
VEDENRPGSINAQAYFASKGMGLKWYNYDDVKRLHDLRLTTTAVGYLPARLVKLMAKDAEDMSRRKWRR